MNARTALLLIALAAGAVACGSEDAPAANGVETAPHPLLGDPRIESLLAPCPQRSLYAEEIGQTEVLIERLVGKLETGQLEVLKRAKEELGAIGAPVVPALRRLIERSYTNAFDSPYIENALGAAALMEDPAARELLLLGFDHPQETVRGLAVTGLRLRHARAEDYERLLERLAAPEAPAMRAGLAEALFRADPARAEALVLQWLRTGVEEALWNTTLPLLVQTDRPETIAAAAAVFDQLRLPTQRLWVAVTGARGVQLGLDVPGSEAAYEAVQTALVEGEWGERMVLCEALANVGWIEPLLEVARSDPNLQVQMVAANHVGAAEGWNDERREALAALLDASDSQLRAQVLQRLVEHGDLEALDRALVQLQSELAGPLQSALLALREPINERAELQPRVQAALEERLAKDEGAPLRDRKNTIKAVGILRTAWAAETLLAIARAHPGERIEGLRAHEWITIQAANTGAAGRDRLLELLAEERDPLNRLDLIRAVSIERTEAARERLFTVLEAGPDSELELLFVADRLARVGPSHLVAPRLKRVLYDVEDPQVRRALSCLMWHWF